MVFRAVYISLARGVHTLSPGTSKGLAAPLRTPLSSCPYPAEAKQPERGEKLLQSGEKDVGIGRTTATHRWPVQEERHIPTVGQQCFHSLRLDLVKGEDGAEWGWGASSTRAASTSASASGSEQLLTKMEGKAHNQCKRLLHQTLTGQNMVTNIE